MKLLVLSILICVLIAGCDTSVTTSKDGATGTYTVNGVEYQVKSNKAIMKKVVK